jgi:uncharacterized protein YceH (UPF0502 family)
VVATALVLIVLAVIDLIRLLMANVSAVGAIVERRISPHAELQQRIARLETELAALRASLTDPRASPAHL